MSITGHDEEWKTVSQFGSVHSGPSCPECEQLRKLCSEIAIESNTPIPKLAKIVAKIGWQFHIRMVEPGKELISQPWRKRDEL